MSPTPPDKQPVNSSFLELRTAKLKHTLQQLFDTLNEAALAKIIQRLQWLEVHGGEQLFEQGEAGDSLYILITGRMQALLEAGTSQQRKVGEISQGECVGEMALITGEPRTATVKAMRDCMLVRLSEDDFQELLTEYPSMGISLSRLIINRLNHTMHHAKAPAKTFNIALVPASTAIPMPLFAEQLLVGLKALGQVQHLNQERLPMALNLQPGASREATFALQEWLTKQELGQDFVVYEAEPSYSPWTRQCLRQADKIIVVTDAQQGSTLSAFEQEVLFATRQKYAQTKELVVLYPQETDKPDNSHQVLAQRDVSRHYNIRVNDQKHMQRLARMITGKGIGLVLSGGGAKGFAHLGIFKALEEAEVPIDMVCGTSMGSIIAAAIAQEWDADTTLETGRSAFVKDKPLSDYTLPAISLIKGHKLQKINKKYFGEGLIENLWLNFFCISGNYSTSEMVVIDKGPVWKAVTASVAIPGVLPPVVEGNDLLIDGCVFNNFPVDVMKARYGGKLIGVDLLVTKKYTLDYTQLPGGWHIFLSKFLPFLKRYKAPSIASIIIKSTILASTAHQRDQVPDLDVFLSPPVSDFGLLDLKSYDKVVAAGYAYAREYFKENDVHRLLLHPQANTPKNTPLHKPEAHQAFSQLH